MDDQHVYVNMNSTKATFRNWDKQSAGTILNRDLFHTVESTTTRSAHPGRREGKTVSRSYCWAAAGSLGLLGLLLLIGLMALLVQYTKGKSKWEMETFQLETGSRYQNLSQLQTSYDRVNQEKRQLQTSYDRVNQERSQLEGNYQRLCKALKSVNWNCFNGKLYYISSRTASWQESREDCKQKGADLVIINNKEEQDFIRRWKKRVWIGLSDKETEGKWTWVDGSLLRIPSYWKTNEPNNEGNEDCGEMLVLDSQNNWNDIPCNAKTHWVCEKDIPE